MKIPARLPPHLPEYLPYNIWVRELANGTAKHLLSWLHDGVPDDQALLFGYQMIEATCMNASLVIQEWIEIEHGPDRSRAVVAILAIAAGQITIDRSKMPYAGESGALVARDLTTAQTNTMPRVSGSIQRITT
jgi:hypothetical protein